MKLFPCVLARWVACIGLLVLGSCAAPRLQPPVDASTAEALWQQRQRQLASIVGWRLQGRIGIVAEHDSGSATLHWEQHPQRYAIRIIAPLGKGMVNIQGDNEQVQMRDTEGGWIRAASAEELIWRRTGWSIPVTGLQRWALGLLDDGMINDYTLDERGRLKTLHSAGWHIEYRDYMHNGPMELPKKIEMQNHQLKLKLKLMINQWEVL